MMTARLPIVCGLAMFVAALVIACSSPDTAGRVDPIGPSREDFKLVAPMLVRRCGTIDCHGSSFRNFRLYGYGGQRLAPADRPDFPPVIQPDELRYDYDAVIGLEPEIMRDVVQTNGAGFDRLTLVRKGRNEEGHKGGQPIKPDDPADTCLRTWLSNATNAAACARAGCVSAGGILGQCQP